MYTNRFLRNRRGVELTAQERARIEAAISEVKSYAPRCTIARAGDYMGESTLLVDGIVTRYLDDRQGLRQLVAIHFPGDFLDLHGFPLRQLDHDVASLNGATVAVVPHVELEKMIAEMPELARKLWFSTLLDAAIHRAWLFRLGRLDAVGRVAHFLCETNARLYSAGLSDGHRFALGLTQADIAEICGLTNIHVNRVMRQLREDGLCVVRTALVEILDLARLTKRGQFDPAYLYIENEQHLIPTKYEAR